MMTATDLAELDITRNMPNEVLNAEEICEYIENMYMAYSDTYDTSLDVPEIILTVGDLPLVISEAMNMPDDKYKIISVMFEESTFWRTCKIIAEYAD